jgi:hypothetical protein
LRFPSFVILVAFGVLLDFAAACAPFAKWHVYLRCLLAGLLANALGCIIRLGVASFGASALGGHAWWYYVLSFAACGALAGIVSGVICFRRSARPAE